MKRALVASVLAILLTATGCGDESDRVSAGEKKRPGGRDLADIRDHAGPYSEPSREDVRQANWGNQDGDDWLEFSDGYSDGFDEGCEELLGLAGGMLYEEPVPYDLEYGDYPDRGEEWDEFDCERLQDEPDDVPFDAPDDPYDAGVELGYADGCNAIFDDEYEHELWTEDGDEIEAADCERGWLSPGAAAGARRAGRSIPSAPPPTSVCPPMRGAVILPVRGKIDCEGALTLWEASMKRAPFEGAGSGGYLELDGWGCIAAVAADPVQLGSCRRLNGTAEFAVQAVE